MTFLSALILFGILVFVHELGHFLFAKALGVKVLKFSLGFGPKLVGRKIGDTEYLVSMIPLGGYVKMLGEEPGEELSPEDKGRAFNNQSAGKRFLILFSGSFFNIALTYFIFVSFLSYGLPVSIPKVEKIAPVVDEVVKGSPAEAAGFKAGDKVVSVGGRDVFVWEEMTEIILRSPGKELDVTVERGGERLGLKVTPEEFYPMGEKEGGESFGRIGIGRKDLPFHVIRSSSVFGAPVKALEATWRMCVFVGKVLKRLLTGSLSLKTVGGPITIFHESGKIAAIGILPYIMFMAFLSANLGIINLLPVPMLDGGHILLLGVEALRGKPLGERAAELTHRFGLAFLLTLILFVTYNDIMRYYLEDIRGLLDALRGYAGGGKN